MRSSQTYLEAQYMVCSYRHCSYIVFLTSRTHLFGSSILTENQPPLLLAPWQRPSCSGLRVDFWRHVWEARLVLGDWVVSLSICSQVLLRYCAVRISFFWNDDLYSVVCTRHSLCFPLVHLVCFGCAEKKKKKTRRGTQQFWFPPWDPNFTLCSHV